MVRNLPTFSLHGSNYLAPSNSITFLIMAMAVVSILSVAAFLCSSEKATRINKRRGEEKRKTVRLGGDNRAPVKRIQSNLSSKALLLGKMISWRKVQSEGEEEESLGFTGDDEEAIWRKTIIKGGKCRPLDFSGNISYDSAGNLVPDS